MKSILIVLVFMGSLFASSIDWPSDYEKALKQAKVENKKVYLFITSDYCKWCREFEDTTLKDKEVLKKLKKDYILLHLSQERHTVEKRFQKLSFVPKHFFLDTEGEILYEDYGYRTEDYFTKLLEELKEKK